MVKPAAALLSLLLAAAQAPGPGTQAAPDVAGPPAGSEVLIARYRLAIADLKLPPDMVFEYTQTRRGPTRVVTENHRVYRDDAGHERNETTAVNGSPVVPARVSIFVRPAWSYGADKFFVDPDLYEIAPRGTLSIDGRKAYSYAVVLKEAGAFAVTDLELDTRTALPLREHFVVTNAACAATGSIDFGPAGRYWLPKIVSVTCVPDVSAYAPATPPSSITFRDTIRFSVFSFPAAIPAQVFGLTPSPQPTVSGEPLP